MVVEYIMEKIEIKNDDCFNTFKEIQDNSIDMIFTDPPYGYNRMNGTDLLSNLNKRANNKKRINPILHDTKEENGDLIENLIKESNRVLKPGSALVLCCIGGGGEHPNSLNWCTLLDSNMKLKQICIWDKGPRQGLGWHYRRTYEFLLIAAKRGAKKEKWHGQNITPDNVIRPGDYDIKYINGVCRVHPNEKPVELSELFIKLHSQEGDTVFDPFMGSGSTGIACIRNNRNFIGVELDKKYYDIAEKRIEEEKEKNVNK